MQSAFSDDLEYDRPDRHRLSRESSSRTKIERRQPVAAQADAALECDYVADSLLAIQKQTGWNDQHVAAICDIDPACVGNWRTSDGKPPSPKAAALLVQAYLAWNQGQWAGISTAVAIRDHAPLPPEAPPDTSIALVEPDRWHDLPALAGMASIFAVFPGVYLLLVAADDLGTFALLLGVCGLFGIVAVGLALCDTARRSCRTYRLKARHTAIAAPEPKMQRRARLGEDQG